MPSRYAETKAEIADNTERVRGLTAAGNREEADALVAETEHLIAGLPSNQRKKPREALREAATPPVVVGELVEQWEHVRDRVEATARHMADGVKAHVEGVKFARQMAEESLQIRLRLTDSDGDPDVHCATQKGRDAQSAMYQKAGEMVPGPREEVEQALELFMYSVGNQMKNVLPEYVRSLTKKEAQQFFPKALEAFPDEKPSEAVFRYYEEYKRPISRLTPGERKAIKRQLDKAREADDLPKVMELESKLGITHDPEETVSTTVAKLRRDLAAAEQIVSSVNDLSPERRKEIRESAEASGELAQRIVEALS